MERLHLLDDVSSAAGAADSLPTEMMSAADFQARLEKTPPPETVRDHERALRVHRARHRPAAVRLGAGGRRQVSAHEVAPPAPTDPSLERTEPLEAAPAPAWLAPAAWVTFGVGLGIALAGLLL